VSNSFGELFRITSFGESHGYSMGIIIDGCPAGLPLKVEDIQTEVDRRRPTAGAGQTTRAEEDKVEILSGVFRGYTTGAPIGLLVQNKDINSTEYKKMKFVPRPGHADYTALSKYGGFNDYRGGGRFSGRATVGLVMAGAVAKKVLKLAHIEVLAHTVQIGEIEASSSSSDEIRRSVYNNPLRCADRVAAEKMRQFIEQLSKEGDSVGGVIEGLALNLPAGLGEPFFDSLEGQMAKALFAIPAVKGVEFGTGFSAARKRGSENNDPFTFEEDKVASVTNNAGGVLGGITTGMPVVVKVAVKPTPSISLKQRTVDLKKMENTEVSIAGRHDVCIVPRAVIVVEAMMAVTLCDFALREGLIKRVIK
jgi:chorismate synthase